MENNFTKEIQYEGVIFRYSRSPSLRKGNEIHTHHEIIYYIDGEATFLSGGIHKNLEKNTLIFVPKGSFHNFQIKHQERYTRLTVSFSDLSVLDEVLPKLCDIRLSFDADILRYADAIVKNMSEEGFAGQSLSVYASFLSLMCELTKEQLLPTEKGRGSDVVTQCMAYIDGHFFDDIKVSELAKIFYVSESFLFSKFKEELGIPIHKYITQRRMVCAKRLLEEGKKPTEVYALCGYSDYSTFYKAYVKRFGRSPKEDK